MCDRKYSFMTGIFYARLDRYMQKDMMETILREFGRIYATGNAPI